MKLLPALLLLAATAGAETLKLPAGLKTDSAVPASIASGWDSGRHEPGSYLDEFRFKDEWGVSRRAYIVHDRRAGIGLSKCDRKITAFYLEDAAAPSDAPADGSVSYKRAVLAAWEMSRVNCEAMGRNGIEYGLSASGTALTPKVSFIYDYGAKKDEEWVLLAPQKREVLSPSPLAAIGAYPNCKLMIDKSLLKLMHPIEEELAPRHPAYAHYAPSKDHEDILGSDPDQKAETAPLAAEKLRKTVFPEAKKEANAKVSGEPEESFTELEAGLLYCRIDRLGGKSKTKFYGDMRAAKDLKTFVADWRGYLHSELKTYAAEAKDLPGAKATDTPWEGYDGFDRDKLLKALNERTEAAVASGGKPPEAPEAKPKMSGKAKKRAHRAIEDAEDRAHDLLKD